MAITSQEMVIPTVCNSHCGGACLLKVHVKEGVITRIETDDGEEPQFRACLRCRAYRQRVYSPDRLLYPLKIIGERGEGKFERISWDEALEKVASEIKRVINTYGSRSIIYFGGVADISCLHNQPIMHRLFSMAGGYTPPWGFISYEGGIFAEVATYGTVFSNNTRDDLLNSKLIIMWAWDPANTIQGTNTSWYLAQAKEKEIRIVSVDPKYTDSTSTFAHEWIPIRPSTDTAMLIAMAYVIIGENLQDQEFLDTYTIGFDKFKEYVLGIEDGIPKTPEWAQTITGVDAGTIERLAREYATTKPAALMAGIAPGRTAYGEQYHRAAHTLAAMTGNVGKHGGSAAGRTWGGEYWGGEIPFTIKVSGRVRSPANPAELEITPRKYTLPNRGRGTNSSIRVNVAHLADAVLQGREGGFAADYKLMYFTHCNYVNQIPDVNKTVAAFKKLEFIVVQEQFMTPLAKFADIVLPTNTFLERNDMTSGGATPFFGLSNKVIESRGESKSPFEIACRLAEKLGIENFSDKTEEEYLQEIVQGYQEAFGIADYDTLKRQAIHKLKRDEPYVAFQKQIEDPAHNPFPTPSGKIEIYCQLLADMNHPEIPPIPKYIEPWEGRNDPLTQRYPLQLVTTHFKRRAHSQFENVPWLRELLPHAMSINPVDAQARGIKDGDTVRVFNDRGTLVIAAKVTERIMPGVVDIPQGAWFNPDGTGVDRGGCANVLTNNRSSPGGAVVTNTTLVQVEKV